MKAPLVLDREAFFAWAEAQPGGRYERIGGEVIAMAPERVEHARLKVEIWAALRLALEGDPACEVLTDGMTIAVDVGTDYEPDVVVHCGPPIPLGTIVVPNPVVIVEVLSPSTRRIDSTIKRENYFRVPSVAHYLTFRADRRQVTHWRRRRGGGGAD